MSHSDKPSNANNWHMDKECKSARKRLNNRSRRLARDLISAKRYEDVPVRFQRTGGWDTW